MRYWTENTVFPNINSLPSLPNTHTNISCFLFTVPNSPLQTLKFYLFFFLYSKTTRRDSRDPQWKTDLLKTHYWAMRTDNLTFLWVKTIQNYWSHSSIALNPYLKIKICSIRSFQVKEKTIMYKNIFKIEYHGIPILALLQRSESQQVPWTLGCHTCILWLPPSPHRSMVV